MTNRILPIVLAGSLVVAAGCGSSGSSSTTERKTQASASEPAKRTAAPYGTYVRYVTRRDIARTASRRGEAGPNQSTPPSGRYRLVIAQGAAQDVIKATDPSDFTIAMDLDAASGTLALTSYVNPSQGAFCGPEIPAGARYAFRVDGTTLVLRPSRPDACADRDSILTGRWTRR